MGKSATILSSNNTINLENLMELFASVHLLSCEYELTLSTVPSAYSQHHPDLVPQPGATEFSRTRIFGRIGTYIFIS